MPDLDDPASIADAETAIDWVKDYISPDDDPAEPGADMFYPIIADDDDNGNGGTKVLGILSIYFFFRNLIGNILPEDSHGIILVFDNACDQTFTYRLDGPHATYLGRGAQTWCNFLIFTLMMTRTLGCP